MRAINKIMTLHREQTNGLNEDEIRAAVQVANNYGSYVAAHSYSKGFHYARPEFGCEDD